LAATSPHDRILERFRQEQREEQVSEEEPEALEDEAAEFSQLSRRSANTRNADTSNTSVHRSASMSDLADHEVVPTAGVSGPRPVILHRASTGEHPPSGIPIHRALSVEGSLNSASATVKENKENFVAPQEPAPPANHGKKTRGEGSRLPSAGRKILNSQNVKSQ